jgi:hypothetical protein
MTVTLTPQQLATLHNGLDLTPNDVIVAVFRIGVSWQTSRQLLRVVVNYFDADSPEAVTYHNGIYIYAQLFFENNQVTLCPFESIYLNESES